MAIELSLIYWNAIDSVHQLAAAAGLPLFRAKEVGQDVVRHAGDIVDDEDEIFAAVPARAALEIPNPPRPMFGIDPAARGVAPADLAGDAGLQGEGQPDEVRRPHPADADLCRRAALRA